MEALVLTLAELLAATLEDRAGSVALGEALELGETLALGTALALLALPAGAGETSCSSAFTKR
jgi:hypothetical protein